MYVEGSANIVDPGASNAECGVVRGILPGGGLPPGMDIEGAGASAFELVRRAKSEGNFGELRSGSAGFSCAGMSPSESLRLFQSKPLPVEVTPQLLPALRARYSFPGAGATQSSSESKLRSTAEAASMLSNAALSTGNASWTALDKDDEEDEDGEEKLVRDGAELDLFRGCALFPTPDCCDSRTCASQR